MVKGVSLAADALGRDRIPEQVFPVGTKDKKHVFPATLEQALELRDQTDLIPCGGATDLLVGDPDPGSFFFLGQIPELKGITECDGYLRIGSNTTFTELLESPLIPQILKDAVSHIASPAIRNAGTIGGNIGNGTAKADTSLIMHALNAEIELTSVDGKRVFPVHEFYRGRHDLNIADNELITALLIPIEDIGDYMYEKVGGRKALAISRISFAGILLEKDGIITDFRATFGAVAPTVLRFPELEAKVVGRPAAEIREQIPEIVADYADSMKFTRGRVSAEYRKEVCTNLLRNFLETRL
ncbi:MAG: FAD binding domain-containing protein [Eubacteriaceae bacterium]